MLIERTNTRRNTARRLEEEISNAADPPHGDQVPPLEEDTDGDPTPVNPPHFTDCDIRAALIQLA